MKNIIYNKDLETFIDINEDCLMEIWDEYKFNNLSEYFHYDDVDYWNEEFFNEMAQDILDKMSDF